MSKVTKSGSVRAIASCPTRISVCAEPGRSTTTIRRIGGGGSVTVTVGTSRRAQEPKAFSAAAKASSADKSPTTAFEPMYGVE
jgi:hypothetical protein